MTIIFWILTLCFAWIALDFYFGRKQHLKNAIKRFYPVRFGNWSLFTDGHDFYKCFFQDISNAKHHIHILFYIVGNDKVSQDFLSLLKRKAREGVLVRLLLDRLGSYKISKKEIRSLRKSGVHFAFSNKPSFPFFFYTLNYRNHRKITVIDGTIGYFGGFNIGKEYIGENPKLGYWQDSHLKIMGDGVQDLQTEFLLDWRRATKEHLLEEQVYFPKLSKGMLALQFAPTDGVFLNDLLKQFIEQAKKEIWIGTPYFIPSHGLLQVLLNALKRGVHVKILVPDKSDHLFIKEASFPFFKPLLHAGCDIYRYTNGFYHAKLILVDNEICDFGTANFDKRSFFINDELNSFIRNDEFVKQIREEFLHDVAFHSKKLTLSSFHNRPLSHRSKELLSSMISDLL